MVGLLVVALIVFSFQTETPQSNDVKAKSQELAIIEFPGEDRSFFSDLSVSFNPTNEFIYLLNNYSGLLYEVQTTGSVQIIDTLSFDYSDEKHFMEVAHDGASILFWERGVGQVYKYDLQTNQLSHISNTKLGGLMYAHGAILDENNVIYAHGGYGFWEFKKLLLMYEPFKNEWLLESKSDEIPQPVYESQFGLWYQRKSKKLISSFRTKEWTQGRQDLILYDYDLVRKSWSERSSISIYESELNFTTNLMYKKTYGINEETGLAFLYEDYFVDLNSNEIIKLTNDDLKEISLPLFFYSKKNDRWIMLGFDQERSVINLITKSYPTKSLQFEVIPTINPIYFFYSNNLWAFILTIFVSIGFGVVFYQIKRKTSSLSDHLDNDSVEDLLKIQKKGSIIEVYHNNDRISITDEYVNKTWEIIYSMKLNGIKRRQMSEFDDELFTLEHSASFRSKIKKKIFHHINHLLDTPIISKAPNDIDKRYKDITVKIERIEIID